ncbi:MAG: hypothetical protein Q7R85_04105 [bacterium]|nr:hypothetical protein [bacterium]
MNRKKQTPQALEAQLVEMSDARDEPMLAKSGLLQWSPDHERLARLILDYCVGARGWKTFTMRQAKKFAGMHSDNLPHFVRAGLLVEADGRYLITDVLILWFAEHLRKPEERAQSVWRRIAGVLNNHEHILYFYDHKLWFVKEGLDEQ